MSPRCLKRGLSHSKSKCGICIICRAGHFDTIYVAVAQFVTKQFRIECTMHVIRTLISIYSDCETATYSTFWSAATPIKLCKETVPHSWEV